MTQKLKPMSLKALLCFLLESRRQFLSNWSVVIFCQWWILYNKWHNIILVYFSGLIQRGEWKWSHRWSWYAPPCSTSLQLSATSSQSCSTLSLTPPMAGVPWFSAVYAGTWVSGRDAGIWMVPGTVQMTYLMMRCLRLVRVSEYVFALGFPLELARLRLCRVEKGLLL